MHASPEKFGILDSLRVFLRYSEGHFGADLDHFLVMVYSCIIMIESQ